MKRNSARTAAHCPPDIALDDLTRMAENWDWGPQIVELHTLNRAQFQAMCVAVGKPQLLLDPVFDFNQLPQSLRNWASDFASRGNRRQQLEWHKESCAVSNAGGGGARQHQFDRLAEIADEWAETGLKPEAARPLSTGEYAAVCLSLNETKELDDPIHSFFWMDGRMQEWVLQRRGMSSLVGQVIGHPMCY